MTAPTASADDSARLKQEAAEYAADMVESGMVVGLGTGSTAIFAVRRIGALLQEGRLRNILAVATSRATEDAARALDIPLMPDAMPHDVDITIDGADEVDPELNLIKGGGGALLREKIVAQASRRQVIVVDETKLSATLGDRWAVPVEVIPFGWEATGRFIEAVGAKVKLRRDSAGAPFTTDSGNIILDCRFSPIQDPYALETRLLARAGVVETGLFLDLATDVIVAGQAGIRHLTRPT
ncbi:MAG: ribose-5-phosphate isomerase RpiA [Anaerolineae bacterium]